MRWVKYLPGDGRSHAMAVKTQEDHPHMRKFKLTREFLRNFMFMYDEKGVSLPGQVSVGNIRCLLLV
jgi:hypothetical protein